MIDRPTPETEKAERMAYSQEYMVPTEFARKLERERDEVRDKAMEALMKIEDLFIDGADVYADREKMGCIAIEALKEAQ